LIVQALNPITNRWTKIDTKKGLIIGCKKSPGAYKGIKIAEKKKEGDLDGRK